MARQLVDPCTEPVQRDGVLLPAQQPVLRQNLQQRKYPNAESGPLAIGVSYIVCMYGADWGKMTSL